jgi:hypothetical protein
MVTFSVTFRRAAETCTTQRYACKCLAPKVRVQMGDLSQQRLCRDALQLLVLELQISILERALSPDDHSPVPRWRD